MVSDAFWQSHFGSNKNILGRTIKLDDQNYVIIGVMPPRFGWWTNEAFWLPLRTDLKDNGGTAVIMRLAPGAVLPDHEHVKIEQTYMLEGKLVDKIEVVPPTEVSVLDNTPTVAELTLMQ